MLHVPNARAATLLPAIGELVTAPATIVTDGHAGYHGLGAMGYRHQAVSVRASAAPAHMSLPVVHRVASLVKRWLLHVHQRPPAARHLDHYLGEFAFRFAHRDAPHRGLLFYRLIEACLATPAPTMAAITAR